MSILNVPEGWVVVQLGDICSKVTDGSHNPPSASIEGLPMLSAKNIHDGRIDFDAVHRLIPIDAFAQEDKRTKIIANDILLTIVGALGRVAVVQNNTPKFTLQRSVAVLAAPMINPNYLRFSFEDDLFQQQILDNAKGTAQKGIYLTKLKELTVALAPLAEQQQIAQKLDELLAQVDTLKTRLDAIPKILKRFRQSVLAAAVSGRLTEAWRGSDEYELKGNKNLPLSWKSEQAQNVCLKVQSGSTPRDNPFDQNGSIPFLKVYNIVNQKIDFNYKPQFVTADVHEKSLKRSIALPNDILMNIVGPPLGKIAVLTNQYPEWNLNQAITLFRANPECLQFMYLYYVLCEGELVRDVMPETKGSVGQVNISLSQCRDALISVPPLEEQTEIVRRVEQLFAYADQIEKRVKDAQARVNHLTQSILAKAFRGELTADWRAQNPALISGENSAAALLERIKAEREATAKPKKKVKA